MRLFVGVPIPQSLAAALGAACQRLAPRLRSSVTWVRPSLMHLTLKFLGETPEERVPAITAALGGLHARPFTLTPQGAGCFPSFSRPRVLWLGFAQGSAELQGLASAVEAALQPLGFPPEERPFTAHLTLGRVKQAAPGDPWPDVLRELARTPAQPFPVERCVLWQSILGPQGPRYVAVAACALEEGSASRSGAAKTENRP